MALLVAACGEQSRIASDAAVEVRGHVLDVDGSPLADRPVRLGSGVSDVEGGLGVLTLGAFCASGACTGDTFDTTTNEDGHYALELTGEDTRSAFGEAVSFLLSTSAPPEGPHVSGAAVAARFRIQTELLDLPELHLVDPDPTIGSAGHDVVVRWDGSAAAPPYSVDFVASGATVWRAESTAPELGIDGRILEDVAGEVGVSGHVTEAAEGSDVEIRWRSPGLGFLGGFGAPPSRGSACTVIGDDGTTEPVPDCGLTDGRFAAAPLPSPPCPEPNGSTAAACPQTRSVRVQLGVPVATDLVVIRGCEGSCHVRGVTDSGASVDLGTVNGPFATVGHDGSALVAVEVGSANGLTVLDEVSVWGPAPAGVTPLHPVEDRSTLGADPVSGGDGSSSRTTALVIAAALLVAVAVGLLLGRSTVRQRGSTDT